MKYVFLACVLLTSVNAQGETSRFFANQETQALAPAAFALQPAARLFVRGLKAETSEERERVIRELRAQPEIVQSIEDWESLSLQEQIPVLRKIFTVTVHALRIQPPDLVIADNITPGPAYFDFNPAQPTPGRVLLNPVELAKQKSPYASLSLLLHETRHSAQFQQAFSSNSELSPFASGYRAAFLAQKSMRITSFCDFLTLVNEYEAFQFSNYILRALSNGKVDLVDMGTYASQYNADGKLKIDLAELSFQFDGGSLLEEFNRLERAQWDEIRR